ncbi:hypothetical protein [Halomarina pelagica]|uniref:hypothetical protein n=1 Tax=Halomarina pelagica TaxID=2961599 RepID=UPI0020C20634|nr:hypothetical protein [Halomarina sp. BND7]
MRSTNIVIFLVLLNASATLLSGTGIAPALGVSPTVGGDEQIEQSEQNLQSVSTDRSALDNFIAGIISAASVLVGVFSIVIAGPLMLSNLGVPGALVAFIFAPLYFIVGLDLLQVLSGRSLT